MSQSEPTATKTTGRRKPNRGRLPSGDPNPIDIHVGARLRLARTLRGMSQDELGRAIGLTFQQVQKYERGSNRISASRIVELARSLDLPVSFFFDCMDEVPVGGLHEPPEPWQGPGSAPTNSPQANPPAAGGSQAGSSQAGPGTREMTELMRAYQSIRDPEVRRKVYELTKVLAASTEGNF